MDGVAGGGGIDGLNDYINDLVQDSLDEVNDKVEDAINNVNGIADDAKKRAGDAIDDARASTDERVGEVDMRSLRESLLLRLSGIQARRPVDVKRDGESFKLRDVIFDSNIP
uniref:Uncharacterized protein n=1 Tax=Tetraselmis chuii TaxID=63592 RepID=A0A7S1X788_9CHLO